jgi:hypothetical protein
VSSFHPSIAAIDHQFRAGALQGLIRGQKRLGIADGAHSDFTWEADDVPRPSWFWKTQKQQGIVPFLRAPASDLLKSLYATQKLSGTWHLWRRTLDKNVVDTSYPCDYTGDTQHSLAVLICAVRD